jgi:hypothetical protein
VRVVCPSAVLAAALLMGMQVASADEAHDTLVADFTSACVAAVLAPETLDAALAVRGLTEKIAVPGSGNWQVLSYGADDGARGINISHQDYADGTRDDCSTAALVNSTIVELNALRQQLEALPALGPLDGQVLPIGPGVIFGRFKRPGFAPLVVIEMTASHDYTSLAISAWSPKKTD